MFTTWGKTCLLIGETNRFDGQKIKLIFKKPTVRLNDNNVVMLTTRGKNNSVLGEPNECHEVDYE